MENPITNFLEVEEEVKSFIKANAKVFDKFKTLLEEYNKRVLEAREYVKKNRKSEGPFKFYPQANVVWDVKMLEGMLDKETFKSITTVTIDKEALEVAIKQGKVNPEKIQIAKLETKEPRCKGPNKVEIPGFLD